VAGSEELAHAPERCGIEARDHDLAFRHQHALDLAQHVVRIRVAFENVRKYHQVDALRRERQL
jgi:hypothetical protein